MARRGKEGRSRVRTAIAATGVTLAVAVVAFLFLADPSGYRVPSESMLPTPEVGERVTVTGGSDPGRGDIVVFHPPAGADRNECGTAHSRRSICPRPTADRSNVSFLMRVVAVPGDRVKIVAGIVYIDGERRREPYARVASACDVCDLPEEVTVPEGHYLMLGDNRAASADGRIWGPVPGDWVEGKLRLRYWPLGRLGTP
jgi:signal peptidase I